MDGTEIYLYRGMDINMYKKLKGQLTPRGTMTTANLYPSDHLYPSDNLFPGNHHLNAIDKHQNPNRYNEDDFKNNSAYLSTTPHHTLSVLNIMRQIIIHYQGMYFI